MKVNVKGTKIILSESPVRDIVGAFFLIYKREIKEEKKPKIYTGRDDSSTISTKQSIEDVTLDVYKGQKEYDLPEGVAKKDIEALYLRVL
jgi:hypothetical protein